MLEPQVDTNNSTKEKKVADTHLPVIRVAGQVIALRNTTPVITVG